MLGCELFEGCEIQYIEGAEPFVMGMDGFIVREIENKFEAEIVAERLIKMAIVKDFIRFDERGVPVFIRDEQEEESGRVDEF